MRAFLPRPWYLTICNHNIKSLPTTLLPGLGHDFFCLDMRDSSCKRNYLPAAAIDLVRLVQYANATRRLGSTSCTASCLLGARTGRKAAEQTASFVFSVKAFASPRFAFFNPIATQSCVSDHCSLLPHSLLVLDSHMRRPKIYLMMSALMLCLDRGRSMPRAR